jgi:hypothetical protein
MFEDDEKASGTGRAVLTPLKLETPLSVAL